MRLYARVVRFIFCYVRFFSLELFSVFASVYKISFRCLLFRISNGVAYCLRHLITELLYYMSDPVSLKDSRTIRKRLCT